MKYRLSSEIGTVDAVTRGSTSSAGAETSEATRRRILDALEHRLREAPTEPVSVDEVATRAAVARTTVYLAFGSWAGLFDALATDLWERAGLADLTEAVAHPDAREHLRGVPGWHRDLRGTARRRRCPVLDVGARPGVRRRRDRPAGGLTVGRHAYLAGRLAEQGLLRDDVTVEAAADVLWMLAGFGSFDELFSGEAFPPPRSDGSWPPPPSAPSKPLTGLGNGQ